MLHLPFPGRSWILFVACALGHVSGAAEGPIMFLRSADHDAHFAGPAITKEPQAKWKVQLRGPVLASPIVHDETLFVGSGGNRFYALDPQTGAEKWAFETAGAVHATAAAHEGLVFVGDATGMIYALDARSGDVRWTRELFGERIFGTKGIAYLNPPEKYYADAFDYFLSSPVLDAEHVYVASGNGNVYAFEQRTGAQRWVYRTHDVVHASPALADGRIHVGSWDTFFHCIDAATGAGIWKLPTGVDTENWNQTGIQSSAVVRDGIVYFGGRDSHVYAVDATTGELRWKTYNDQSWVIVSPLVEEARVYYTTSDSMKFRALNRTNGEIEFELPIRGWGFSSPIAVGGLIYFGSFAGDITAIDPETQSVRWRFLTDEAKADAEDILRDEDGVLDPARVFANSSYERSLEARRLLFSAGAVLSTPFPYRGTLIFGTGTGALYAIE